MIKSTVLSFLFKRNIKNYSIIVTKMDEIEKGKRAAAYMAIDENINNVIL
jgi:GTP-binding protein EngB required for normal cell division